MTPGSNDSHSDDSIERFGEFLVRIGALSNEAVGAIVARQKQEPGKLFGQIAVELGYLTSSDIDAFLSSRRVD